jgi:hypothetical protein
MLHYLLNVTATWLLSLVVFDVFLRRETHHTYNRMYLSGTLLLGILLPLWSWQSDALIYTTNAISKPVEQVAIARENLVNAAETSKMMLSWQDALWLVYLIGVGVAIAMVIKELFVIAGLYKKGTKSKDGVWTIIETGKEHTPFSAFRMIFLNSKQNYNDEQLRIILMHEEQHGHSLHFIDLLMMQLAKIVFWFHPLIYIYHSRLMMIHEYQADAAVEKSPNEYGHFLIEQSMLRSAPVLSHSFNRSPVKKRILMLTRKSAAASRLKQLLVLPLVLVCVFCFTENAFSGDSPKKNGNKLVYKGNEFEMWGSPPDTVQVEDPVTGEWTIAVTTIDSFPIKMNNETIYRQSEMSQDELAAISETTIKQLHDKLYEKVEPEIAKLPDGEYSIYTFKIIVDKKGNTVYAQGTDGFNYNDPGRKNKDLNKQIEAIAEKVTATLNNRVKVSPAKRGGVPVVFMVENLFNRKVFVVKNHNVTLGEPK